MKKIIAILAMLTAVSAQAQVSFGDLNFFVKQGQFQLSADANRTTEQYKISPGGAPTRTEGNAFATQLNFGLSDQLNLFAGVGYNYLMKTDNTSTPTRAWTQDGFTNPLVGGNFRVINQNDSLVNFDLGFVARFAVQDQVTGAAVKHRTEEGNAANARSAYELNTSVGRKWNEANEFRLTAGLVYNNSGERDQKVVDGSTKSYDVDSSTDAYLRAAYQYRPVNEFILGLALTGTRISAYDEDTTGTKVKNDSHMDVDARFIAKCIILPNFIARFTFAETMNPDYDYKTNGAKETYKSRRSSVIGLGADFLF